jgi:Bacterial proteasome activator
MSDPAPPEPELVTPNGFADRLPSETDGEEPERESVAQPAKVMRVGSMIRQLLEEAHNTSLDEASRQRLVEIYHRSVEELGDALSPDLRDELDRLAFPFLEGREGEAVPTEAELRIAQAQLIGWLEGLFHGIQATLFAQQMAARQQLEQMRGQLPPGAQAGAGTSPDARPGTYL